MAYAQTHVYFLDHTNRIYSRCSLLGCYQTPVAVVCFIENEWKESGNWIFRCVRAHDIIPSNEDFSFSKKRSIEVKVENIVFVWIKKSINFGLSHFLFEIFIGDLNIEQMDENLVVGNMSQCVYSKAVFNN